MGRTNRVRRGESAREKKKRCEEKVAKVWEERGAVSGKRVRGENEDG